MNLMEHFYVWWLSNLIVVPLIHEIIYNFLLKVHYFNTHLFHANIFGSVNLSSLFII